MVGYLIPIVLTGGGMFLAHLFGEKDTGDVYGPGMKWP